MGPVLPALLRQRRRLILAAIAVAVGVGYLAGTLGLLGRIGQGLDDLSQTSADRADLVVEGEIAYESTIEQVRRLVPATVVDIAERTDGIASASHRLEDVAIVVDSSGEPVVDIGLSEQPLGQNWPEDSSVSPVEIVEGDPPTAEGEVAIDSRSAEAADLGIGDDVTVAGRQVETFKIVGLAQPPAGGINQGASLTVVNTADARRLFDRPVDDNRVAIMVEEGADIDEVADRLAPLLPGGTQVVTGDEAAEHQAEALTRSFSLISLLVIAFGVLALLVGMLTVANSLTLLHSQRRHLYATFRTIGAGKSQIRFAATTEAVLLAVFASLIGLPFGLLIAWLIERALGALGTAIPTSGPRLTPTAAAIALGIGILTTVVAAWKPVSRASSVPPIEALRPAEEIAQRANPLPTALSWAAVLGVGAAGISLLAGQTNQVVLMAAAGAAGATFVILLLPWVLSRSVALVIRIGPFRPRPLRRVAARDAARNPRRTASTAAAVLVSTAVLTGLVAFLASFTESVSTEVDGLVVADLVVDSGTFTRGGLPLGLIEELEEQPGVSAASGWQLARGFVGQYSVRMTGLDGDSATEVISPSWVGEAPTDLDSSSVWLAEPLAEDLDVVVGDDVDIVFTSGGLQSFSVTGIYSSGRTLLGDVVTERSIQSEQVPATVDLAALVLTDGSADAEEAVIATAGNHGVDTVLSPSEFVDSRSELLRGFQSVILWMLLFTFLQALIGVVNTLTMAVGERRREIGLLRVSGATRRQVRRMVLFEGSALSIVGSVFGVALGLGGAVAGVKLLADQGIGEVKIPWLVIGLIAVAAVAVGVVSSVIPARMAAAIPPLEAITDTAAGTVAGKVHEQPVESAHEVAPAALVAVPPVPAALPPAPGPDTQAVPAAPRTVGLGSITVQDQSGSHPLEAEEEAALLALFAAAGSPANTAEAVPLPGESSGSEAPPPLAEPPPAPPPLAEPPPISAQAPDTSPSPFGTEAALDDEDLAEGELVDEPGQGEAATQDDSSVPYAQSAPVEQGPEVEQRPPVEQVPEVEQHPPVEQSTPVEQDSSAAGASKQSSGRGRRDRIKRASGRKPRRKSRDAAAAAEGWVSAAPEPIATEPEPFKAPAEVGGSESDLAAVPEPEDISAETLAVAIRRMSPGAASGVSAALGLASAHIADGETVSVGVSGQVRGWPALVLRTDRRILVIVERDKPVITSLHPDATQVSVTGEDQNATLTVTDRGRELVLEGVVDDHLAREMQPSDSFSD